MRKITFKVSTKKEGSVVSIIKEINNISCRIHIDLENGLVEVENVSDTMVNSVIELIDEYYNILNVMIDNTSDEAISVETSKSVIDVDESKCDAGVESKSDPTVIGPQSENDLIIKKVNFKNKYVESLINKLLRAAFWAMYKMNVPEREIGDFIWTSISEISMKYSQNGTIEYSVGDIVDCNYGYHLDGEISGNHVFAIVCSKIGGMAYLVPIFKIRKNLNTSSYLTFNAPKNIVFNNYYCDKGVVFLDKGRYLKDKRIFEVVGKATPEFFIKVLEKLSTTFDFTSNVEMADDNTKTDFDNEIAEGAKVAMDENTVENTSEENATDGDVAESNPIDVDNSDVTTTEPKSEKSAKKIGIEEAALLDCIGESLKKLDPTKKVEEQVYNFLTDIGMTTSERMVTQAFVVACDINKINYEKVILKLHDMFPKVNEKIIKSILKGNFKNWLDLHPELVKSCPKISFISVLKVFAKRFS